jgi:hypothetical protein
MNLLRNGLLIGKLGTDGEPTNGDIRILMQVFSRVHNML